MADQYPPENALVRWGTSASSLLILGLALGCCWINRKRLTRLHYLIMLLSITIASPIAWEHTYGFTFIIFFILWEAAFRAGPRRAALPVAIISLAYLLSSHFLHFVNTSFADTGWNFLQSYLLFGELIVLALMYRYQQRSALVE